MVKRRVGSEPGQPTHNQSRHRPHQRAVAGEDRDELADVADRVAVALSTLRIHGLLVAAFRDGHVRIDGTVAAEGERIAAGPLARVAGITSVDNALVVDPVVATMPINAAVLSEELAAELELNHLHFATGTEIDLTRENGTTDTARATDEAEPYFPPTDPPTRRASRADEGLEIVGGFSQTSLDTPIELELRPRRLLAGDDEIAREVRLALAEDAATADLDVQVTVRRRVVHLRGVVGSVIDAEVAEEVASRVPNVEEVVEDLEVANV